MFTGAGGMRRYGCGASLCRRVALGFGVLALAGALPATAASATHAHGLWVWKGPTVLAAPQAAVGLVNFCRAEGITEVYVSALDHGKFSDPAPVAQLIELLHHSGIRVEALLSSTDADEAGKHRDTLLAHVRSIVEFDQSHPQTRFDGVHLDVEPQQRAENKGAGNLRFLPGLVETYRAVRAIAEPAALTTNADIQNKLLKGDLSERRSLLQSLPRLTLMLYALGGGDAARQKAETLRAASRKFLDMAYDGLQGSNLATLVIGLRTADYGAALPGMLKSLDDWNGPDPRYGGWARHSYNDVLAQP